MLRADGTAEPLPELESGTGSRPRSTATAATAPSTLTSRAARAFRRCSTATARASAAAPEEPGLDAERATNYEVGVSDTLFSDRACLVGGLLFRHREPYPDGLHVPPTAITRSSSTTPTARATASSFRPIWDATRTLRVGGNYTYLERDLDFAGAARRLASAGTVMCQHGNGRHRRLRSSKARRAHEAFLYAGLEGDKPAHTDAEPRDRQRSHVWSRAALDARCRPVQQRTTATRAVAARPSGSPASPNYINIGSYALLNFRADYDFTENFSTAVGVTNLLDQNYSLADGFPEPGRQFYATARASSDGISSARAKLPSGRARPEGPEKCGSARAISSRVRSSTS